MRRPFVLLALLACLVTASLPAAAADTDERATPFIIGGTSADEGEWPFIAALVTTGAPSVFAGQYCAGAVIAPTLILTAAHCAEGFNPADISIGTGFTNLSSASMSDLIAVTEIHIHPQWVLGSNAVQPYDLAVLRLAAPAGAPAVGFADPTSEATLWAPGTIATAIGWGAIDVSPVTYPTVLQELDVQIISDTSCEPLVSAEFLASSNICAGEPGSTNDGLCFGDSGGPVVVPNGAGGWLTIGLTSWGTDPCASTGQPDVFTEVAAFNDWIAGFLDVERVAGTDRYSTAAALSARLFAPGVPVVYLATGLDFPDALAASAAAGSRAGPVLLTDPNVIPTATRNEISRLDPDEIIVVGGTGVVSAAVFDDLIDKKYAPVVKREAGIDRFATAEAVSIGAFATADVLYVATGFDFPDALAAGAAAGVRDGPILLTGPDTLAAAVRREIARLGPSEIVLVGGTAAVSDAVFSELSALVPTVRRAGSDRYSTAAAVSAEVHPPGATTVYVATGLDFPDALAAAAAAAATDSPIVLTATGSLPSATKTELSRLEAQVIVVVGGTSVVSQSVVAELTKYAG